MMHHLWDTTTWKYVTLIWPFTVIQRVQNTTVIIKTPSINLSTRCPIDLSMTGTYETYAILFWDLSQHKKVDATITKLGWTTYMSSFSKWPPVK